MYYISIRQRGTSPMTIRGSGIQTPSYILSPLDSGPHQIQFRMPISFSPFLPFGAFGTPPGDRRRFLLFLVKHGKQFPMRTADKLVDRG